MHLFRRSPETLSLAESRNATSGVQSRSVPPTLDKHLLDYIRVLVKRRWSVVITFVMALALAWMHLRGAVPIYEAQAQILIEHESQTTFSLQESVAQDRETTDYYNTQYTILQSRSLAKRALEAMAAWTHPELVGGRSAEPTGVVEGAKSWILSTMARLRGKAPQATATPAAAEATPTATPTPSAPGSSLIETPAQASAIDGLLSRLRVSPVKTSRLVDLKVQATDPKFAADAANALARAYIDQNLEVRMTSSKETSDWLTQQLSEQRRRVEESENALQKYRETHDAISLADPKNTGGQNIVGQKLSDLNGMVTRAKADRISREALYRQVQSAQSSGVPLDTIPAIMSNGYIQQVKSDLSRLQADRTRLSSDLLDGHPEMVKLKTAIQEADAKLQREIAKQVDGMKNEYEAAMRLEASLTQALETQKGEVTVMSRTGIDYGVLERDVATNRQIFETLLSRTREKGIAGELKASDARIIDAAQIPRSPIWPKRNETFVYAAIIGLFLAIALAFFVEYMDDSIKTPDEIKSYLGLPCLGIIPIVTKRKPTRVKLPWTGDGTPVLGDTVGAHFSEAFRALRTNVLFSAEQLAQSLVFTSTGPGEGKTVVACNVALGMAMAGRKAIIIDVDMRRPRLHDVFGVAQTPGLSDFLAGTASLEQGMRELPGTGLRVIPSGGRTENPAEMLASPQFAQMLTTLASQFEWIILDSPPVAAVTDACIVANRASAVIFVVGSQKVRRSAALHAIEQLESARATFLGAVLNQVHLRRDAFYYSSYYRPEYDKYFSRPGATDAKN